MSCVCRDAARFHDVGRHGGQSGPAAGRALSVRGSGLFRDLLCRLALHHTTGRWLPAMIKIHDVSKWYTAFQVLKACSVSIARGEVIVVCGPSGSGKSTLTKCVNGLEPFDEGEIVVDGLKVADKADLRVLRTRIGMVFQNFELYPHLSALDNICLAPMVVLKRRRAEAETRARTLLARVGLTEHAAKFPLQLSGGQQQRVAIARALAMDPIAMHFDEPTSALDPEMVSEVLDVMTALARDGMTMICVTHEMGFARRVANRILFIDRGQVIDDRPTASFFGNERSDRAALFLSKILNH